MDSHHSVFRASVDRTLNFFSEAMSTKASVTVSLVKARLWQILERARMRALWAIKVGTCRGELVFSP